MNRPGKEINFNKNITFEVINMRTREGLTYDSEIIQ